MSWQTLAKIVATIAVLLVVTGALTALAVVLGYVPSPSNWGAPWVYASACLVLFIVASIMDGAE